MYYIRREGSILPQINLKEILEEEGKWMSMESFNT